MLKLLSVFLLISTVLAFHPAEAARLRAGRRCAYVYPLSLFYCRTSPLIIQVSKNPEQIELTPIQEGIQFDLLGIPGKKQQISWLTMSSTRSNYFLALPDSYGRVNGIQELFGDNTVGPDQKKSRDGFQALKKYDQNGDGVIDARDPVFDRLRMWSDANLDGLSDPRELHELKEFGIEMIGLGHEAGRFKSDKHGNYQSMPSLVRTRENGDHFMFDLWFRTIQQ